MIQGGASEALLVLAELLQAPVTCSLMGLGGFPGSHRQFTGMIGMHGTRSSNLAANSCDVLLAIGARFSDRVVSNLKRFAPDAKIVHVDIDAAEINKNVLTYQQVIGDVKHILKEFNSRIFPKTIPHNFPFILWLFNKSLQLHIPYNLKNKSN